MINSNFYKKSDEVISLFNNLDFNITKNILNQLTSIEQKTLKICLNYLKNPDQKVEIKKLSSFDSLKEKIEELKKTPSSSLTDQKIIKKLSNFFNFNFSRVNSLAKSIKQKQLDVQTLKKVSTHYQKLKDRGELKDVTFKQYLISNRYEPELKGYGLKHLFDDKKFSKLIENGLLVGFIFSNCQADHLNLKIKEFKGLEFENCKFNNCQFNHLILQNVEFTDCQFLDCSFYDSRFDHVKFNRCALQKTDFSEVFVLNSEIKNSLVFDKQTISYQLYTHGQFKFDDENADEFKKEKELSEQEKIEQEYAARKKIDSKRRIELENQLKIQLNEALGKTREVENKGDS